MWMQSQYLDLNHWLTLHMQSNEHEDKNSMWRSCDLHEDWAKRCLQGQETTPRFVVLDLIVLPMRYTEESSLHQAEHQGILPSRRHEQTVAAWSSASDDQRPMQRLGLSY